MPRSKRFWGSETSIGHTETVRLRSEPTADGDVTLSATQVTLGATTLTFTSANWNGLQTVSVTDEQIQKYYEQNGNQFLTPETVDLQYIELTRQQAESAPGEIKTSTALIDAKDLSQSTRVWS